MKSHVAVTGHDLHEDAGAADGDFAERVVKTDGHSAVLMHRRSGQFIENVDGHGFIGFVAEAAKHAVNGMCFHASSAEKDAFRAGGRGKGIEGNDRHRVVKKLNIKKRLKRSHGEMVDRVSR